MSSTMEIDGSLGEGGGQVLRIALCLSALYKIPIKITNIRAGRVKPGIAAQHLKGVELLKDMCNATVQGAYIGSTVLEFKPGHVNNNERHTFVADTQTAGCISLLAQVALPLALFMPHRNVVTLILKGGTNVPMGPHVEYLTEVFRVLLKKFGADFDFEIIRRGYYPRGGGEVHLYVKPVHVLKAVTLTEPGIVSDVQGWAYVAGAVPIREAHKMVKDAKSVLIKGLQKHNIPLPRIDLVAYKEDSFVAVGSGSGVNIVCSTTGGCVFGSSGLGSKHAEKVSPGVQAANDILYTILSGSCIDEHAQDQLIILMALARGISRIHLGNKKLTCHTETAIKVAETILNDFNLHFNISENTDADGNTSYILECEGCGYENKDTI